MPGAWIVGFFPATYLLGFVLAIPLFVLGYMKSHGIKLAATITFAVVMATVIYVLFELVLGVDLYKGLLLGAWLQD